MKFTRTVIIAFILYIIHCTSFAQWSAIGSVDNQIFDFMEWNSKLHMVGAFTINGNAVNGICSYDGVNFDSLGPGFGAGGAASLAVYNNELYAGGSQALGPWPHIPCSANIDKWDSSNWSCVGAGGPGGTEVINAMAVYNGELYVGGNFFSMGGVTTKHIARWDGTQWKTVGGGIGSSGPGTGVYSMAVYKGQLYIGGFFSQAGTITTYNVARWNGTQWDSLGSYGVNGGVGSFVVDTVNNVLYVGGGITNAGGVPCWSVAKWDSINFSSPGMGITDGANAMAMYQGKLVVGGFSKNGSITDTVLATWDGNYWCPILPGPNGGVTAMEVYNGELYIGGYFDTVAAIPASHLVKWSGNLCPNSAVSETYSQIKFKVYPNPAKAEINIKVEEGENKEYTAIIYNSVGARIAEQKFSKQTKISTSNFSKGIYQVQVCDKNAKICHAEKLVLE